MKQIKTKQELITEIEDYGLVKFGKRKGYIQLNNLQWERIKSKVV